MNAMTQLAMLTEMPAVRQIPGEPYRRWFCSESMDLIWWTARDGRVYGFQLCYHKGRGERAFTWRADRGFSHRLVDSGTYGPWSRLTPVLTAVAADANLPAVAEEFRQLSVDIDPKVAGFVYLKMLEYVAAPAA